MNARLQVTDDWRAVLKDPEISAVVIGTWPYMHALLTIEALKAGKHVLCEARAAMDAREAHEMLRVSRQNPGLVVQIVPSPFTLPYDATIRDIIRSGKLGRLTYIEVRGVSSQYPDPPGAPMHFRQNREYSGLNILTMGIFYEALDLRAPTEAFFQAWFAASNATALLEFASYNRSELRHARDAVLGLLLPQDFFNRTFPGGPGQPDDKPPHSDSDMPPHDDGAMPPDSQPNPQDSSRQPGGQPQEGDNQPPQGAPGDAPQDAPQGGDSRGPDGGRHLLSRDNGPGGANPGPGGMGGNRPGHGPFPGAPMNVTECPEVTLTPVDAIVEGSAGCLLEDCLACAGVDGCTCVSCRCQCA
ncbi:hypothetical protein N2152v2_003276 [Parachlorella kessleri]